jgi:hypothetical protein
VCDFDEMDGWERARIEGVVDGREQSPIKGLKPEAELKLSFIRTSNLL